MYFHLEHWHWWVLSLLFVVSTAVIRSPVQFMLCAATTAVGVLAWMQPTMPAKTQLLIFGLLMGVGLVIAQFVQGKNHNSQANDEQDGNFIDRDDSHAADLIGRTLTLDSPIVDGMGSISFDNQTWKLRGEDASSGTKIRIESVDGIDSNFLEVSIVE